MSVIFALKIVSQAINEALKKEDMMIKVDAEHTNPVMKNKHQESLKIILNALIDCLQFWLTFTNNGRGGV